MVTIAKSRAMRIRRSCSALLLVAVAGHAAVLLQHNYDALGDRIIALALRGDERLTQSFTAPQGAGSAVAIRLKVRRVGHPGALEYRIGAAIGGDEVAAGEIAPEHVQPYFERFVSFPLKQAEMRSGKKYFVQIRLNSGSDGYYEVFGTSQGEESPINIDYGAVTPGYEGGEAYDTSDRTIPGVDFAFQLIGPGPGPQIEEPFAFISDLIAPIHYQRARFANSHNAGVDEVVLDGSWWIDIPASASMATLTAASEFQRFMNAEMGVALSQTGTKHITLRTVADSPSDRPRLTKSEAFVLDVSPAHITITGYDDRGVMRGLYYLQDVLDLRQAPLIKTGTTVRTPRYNPRITCAPFFAGIELEPNSDPYTDGLLAKISHAGYNAIWVWSKIYQLGTSSIFPELGADSAARLTRFRAIADRAAKYGMDVYAYVTIDPLPPSFFDKHPDARGVPRANNQFYGAGYVLCPSSHEVQRYLEEATASIFRGVPGLRGAVMIPYGEGLFTCRTSGASSCKRCANRPLDDVLTDLVTAIQRGALAGNPKAEVVTWTYTWPQTDPSRAGFIAKLPNTMTWMDTFEKEGIVRRDGVWDSAYDYSISYLGPAENFLLQAPLVEKAGMPFWAKTESMISEEFVQTPYIPVYQRWEERYRRLAKFPRLTGLFMNWNHYGFMPSRVAELVKWFTWDPAPQNDDVLRQIAARDFGENAADGFVEAWRTLSDAISYFPFSDGTTRSGPLQKGPAHPFFWNPDYQPHFSARRQFFNNLNWTQPWDVNIATKYYSIVEQKWAKGTEMLRNAAAQVDAEHRMDAERELGVAEMQLSCLRTVLHLINFYGLRFDLNRAADPQPVLEEMKAVLQQEQANSRRALELVEKDSRLGYANGGNGITNGGVRAGILTAASIQKKLAQLDRVLNQDIPNYHEGR